MKATGLTFILLIFLMGTCHAQDPKVSLAVLGTVQDAGSPHIGCEKECCALLFEKPDPSRMVVALGIVDHENQKTFLFEATPDMPKQLKTLKRLAGTPVETPNGIFLTHAHIGHYTGLMYLGREALGSWSIPVYAMPKMKAFLENNAPWSQLVALRNITLEPIANKTKVQITSTLAVLPFTVPHRDEFSETVGYKIIGPNKTVLFIPDIDKWDRWETAIVNEIKKVDHAFLDATFFDGNEVAKRDILEIPHPFAIESMALFHNLPKKEKAKIHFIHFNHTNPLLNENSKEHGLVRKKGFNIAKAGSLFQL